MNWIAIVAVILGSSLASGFVAAWIVASSIKIPAPELRVIMPPVVAPSIMEREPAPPKAALYDGVTVDVDALVKDLEWQAQHAQHQATRQAAIEQNGVVRASWEPTVDEHSTKAAGYRYALSLIQQAQETA